jgi:hypothetical protein
MAGVTHRECATNLRELAEMIERGTDGCLVCAEGFPEICEDCRHALGYADQYRHRAAWHDRQPADEPAFPPLSELPCMGCTDDCAECVGVCWYCGERLLPEGGCKCRE